MIHWDYTGVIVLYLALTLGIALYYGRKETKSVIDFTVGGRRFGIMVLFFTMLATMVGAASTIGYTGWYWIRGISQLWFVFGGVLAFAIFIYYLGPKINKFGFESGATTPGQWMEHRYGKVAKYITSILLIVAYLAITAFNYMAMGTILEAVTGIPYEWGLVIAAVIVTVYTSLGGLWSVASTDVLQGALTLIGLTILAPILIMKAGGLGNIMASLPSQHLQPFGYVDPVTALAYTLVFFLGILSWPDLWQRVYAAKDVKTMKQSFTLYIVAFLFLLGGLVLLIGLAGRVLYPDFPNPEHLLPYMVMEQLPGIFGAFIMACLIAVIMGTADSTLLITAVMFEEDIYSDLRPKASEAERLKVGQIVTFIGGILVLVLAYITPTMFDLWVKSADITGATLAIPILLGFAWKRPSYAAGMAGIIAGFIGWALGYAGILGPHPIIVGAILSLIAYLVVAFIAPSKPKQEKAEEKEETVEEEK